MTIKCLGSYCPIEDQTYFPICCLESIWNEKNTTSVLSFLIGGVDEQDPALHVGQACSDVWGRVGLSLAANAICMKSEATWLYFVCCNIYIQNSRKKQLSPWTLLSAGVSISNCATVTPVDHLEAALMWTYLTIAKWTSYLTSTSWDPQPEGWDRNDLEVETSLHQPRMSDT